MTRRPPREAKVRVTSMVRRPLDPFLFDCPPPLLSPPLPFPCFPCPPSPTIAPPPPGGSFDGLLLLDLAVWHDQAESPSTALVWSAATPINFRERGQAAAASRDAGAGAKASRGPSNGPNGHAKRGPSGRASRSGGRGGGGEVGGDGGGGRALSRHVAVFDDPRFGWVWIELEPHMSAGDFPRFKVRGASISLY